MNEISQYTSVQQHQVEDTSPGSPCLQDAPTTQRFTQQQAIKLTPVIYQLDRVFIITTQQGSDRGRKQQRERWRSGGSNGRGEELRLAGGEEEERGGDEWRERRCWVLCGAKGLCHAAKVSVCFFL